MARVSVFQGGNVQSQGTTNARVRSANFGESPLAEGLQKLGEATSKAVTAVDQIQDIRAKAEATELDLEHLRLTQEVNKRVSSARGLTARDVASQATTELEKQTSDLVARASPRARMLLQDSATRRTLQVSEAFHTYGEKQFVTSYDKSLTAKAEAEAEEVYDIDDEATAVAQFEDRVAGVLREQATFMGEGREVADVRVAEARSTMYVQRATRMAATSAVKARDYLMANRDKVRGKAFDAALNAWENEAMLEEENEWADGHQGVSEGVAEADAYYARDPLAPIPKGEAPLPTPATAIPARAEKPLDLSKGFGVTSELGRRGAPATGGGRYGSSNHKGLDLPYPTGTPVPATLSGVARVKSDPDGYGNYVVIDHGDGLETRYAHLSGFTIKDGQTVKKGEIIGKSGNTGNSSGPHLHHEARLDGKPVDPRTIGERTVHPSGTGGAMPTIAAPANGAPFDLQASIAAVRADDSISPKRKSVRIRVLKERYGEWEGARADDENEASRAVTLAMVQLGDDFTSVSQLPQDAVLRLNPSMLSTVYTAARSNKESKPLPLTVQADIATTLAADPRVFLKPEVQQRLLKAGVTPRQLGELVQAGGRERGNRDKPGTAEPLSGSTMLTIARPHLAAAGIHLTTLDESKGDQDKAAGPAERAKDASRQLAVITYLTERQNEWRTANPGKQPPEDVIRKWTGWAVLMTKSGNRAFEAGDEEIYTNLSPARRESLRRTLFGNGPMPPVRERVRRIVDLHQKEVTLSGR